MEGRGKAGGGAAVGSVAGGGLAMLAGKRVVAWTGSVERASEAHVVNGNSAPAATRRPAGPTFGGGERKHFRRSLWRRLVGSFGPAVMLCGACCDSRRAASGRPPSPAPRARRRRNAAAMCHRPSPRPTVTVQCSENLPPLPQGGRLGFGGTRGLPAAAAGPGCRPQGGGGQF